MKPRLGPAVARGLQFRCPVCGEGPAFAGYLAVRETCPTCQAPLGRIRADDAPPWATIMIVAHVVVPLMLWLEQAREPALWVHAAIFLPLTVVLSLALLRPVKGAFLGLMAHLGITGRETGDHPG